MLAPVLTLQPQPGPVVRLSDGQGVSPAVYGDGKEVGNTLVQEEKFHSVRCLRMVCQPLKLQD